MVVVTMLILSLSRFLHFSIQQLKMKGMLAYGCKKLPTLNKQ